LYAHIAAIDPRLPSTRIIRATFEDGLQCPIVKLTGEAVAAAGWAVGVEGVAGEEGSCVERERSISGFGKIQCRQCELSIFVSELRLVFEGRVEKACLVATRFNGNRLTKLGQADKRLVYAAGGLRRQ
jgi:hypothetical protein